MKMKQHITLKQWDEITKEQKNILWDSGFKNDWKMNIGQMIEFLGDDDNQLDIFIEKIKLWRIELDHGKENYSEKSTNEYVELCDALWEAVKYKLN